MSDEKLTAFLMVVDTTQNDVSEIVDNIDQMPEIVNWLKFLENSIIVITPLDVKALNEKLMEKLPKQRYIITRLERGAKEGWLPKKTWDFMNDPKPA